MKNLLYIFLFFIPYLTYGQVKNIGLPPIKKYSPLEINGSPQTWAVTHDERGVMYFGNSKGIIEYDGKNWTLIELTNKSTVRSFLNSINDTIYVAGYADFGYLAPDYNSRMSYKSLMHRIPEEYRTIDDVWAIYDYMGGILLMTFKRFLWLSPAGEFKTIESENGFHVSFKIGETIYVREWEKGFCKLDNFEAKLLKGGEKFAKERIYTCLPFEENILIGTRNMGFFTFDGEKFSEWETEAADYITKNQIYKSIILSNEQLLINTNNGGIVVLNKSGKVDQLLSQERGLICNGTYAIDTDLSGNLWIAQANGISYAEINTPISEINEYLDFTGSIYNTLIFHDTLFIACEDGVYFYPMKTKKNPLLGNDKIQFAKGSAGQSWDFYVYQGTLMVAHNPAVLVWENQQFKSVAIEDDNVWLIQTFKNNPDRLIIGTHSNIRSLEKINNKWKVTGIIKGHTGTARNFFITNDSTIWMSNNNKGVNKLTINKAQDSITRNEYYGINKGLPSELQNIAFQFDNKIMFTTSQGIYLYNPKADTIVPFDSINRFFSPLPLTYSVKPQNENQFMFSYDKKTCQITKTNIGYEIDTTNYKFMSGAFASVSYLNENEQIIDAQVGMYHYQKSRPSPSKISFNTLIRSVTMPKIDSMLFGGAYFENGKPVLNPPKNTPISSIKFEHNNIFFKFSSTWFQDDKEMFSYILEGFDDNWSPWTLSSEKEYTNIPEGKYIFKVKSRNLYYTETAEAIYEFVILPPWYRTTLAYFVYIILLIIIFRLGVAVYTRRLKAQNKELEKIVKQRTKEIQLQNDEILQQNAEIIQKNEEISSQAEQLVITNQELQKLSIVAQETDNAVSIYDEYGNIEWINEGFSRVYGYCLDEYITEHGQHIKDSVKNPKILNIIDKCFEDKKSYNFQSFRLTKRDSGVWIQTTITPILKEDDSIFKIIAIDSDISKLKDAEQEILAQRDELQSKNHEIRLRNEHIQSSIRYALNIQRAILPLEQNISTHFHSFVIYKPKDIVSGDFYWSANCENQKLKSEVSFLAMVDCTGHGVPGAFMSMIGNRLLNEIIVKKEIFDTVEILEEMDAGIKRTLKQDQTDNNDGMDISLCKLEQTCRNNTNEIKVTFSGTKQSIVIYYRATNTIERIKGDVRTIGGRRRRRQTSEKPFTAHEFIITEGDGLYLFTDGFKDQNADDRKKFGMNRLYALLEELAPLPIEQQKQIFEEQLNIFMQNSEQRDDISLIGLSVKKCSEYNSEKPQYDQ